MLPKYAGRGSCDLFSRRGWAIGDPKNCREIPGGGEGWLMTGFFERAK